jgi:hypothetical protein
MLATTRPTPMVKSVRQGCLRSRMGWRKAGDRLCPITCTVASPKFARTGAGKQYLLCCPPCIDEFVRLAKEKPDSVRPPEAYVKR